MHADELHERVRNFAAAETPALLEGRVLIAVSGGADSIAMAALLGDAGIVTRRQRAVVAHFDHHLRGAAAARRDLTAVVALCARYNLDIITGSWDAPRLGEAAAREARYAFLREAAAKAGAQVLVTGHTSDDQAETVLMHAMRGAGLHGLRGIKAQSIVRGITLARPLLCVSRDETRAYCGARDLTFVDDATNGDTSLLRNKVRLQLLPAMESASPGVRAALLRTAREASDAVIALDGLVATAVTRAGDDAVLLKTCLRALSPAVWPYALRSAVELVQGHARDLGRHHYELISSAMSARTGSVLQLPGGLALHVESAAIVLMRSSQSLPVIPPAFEASLPFAGRLGSWDLHVQPAALDESTVHLPPDAVVRRRRPGDRIRIRAGGRKLQDFFVDLKVPRRERDAIPLIAAGSNVLWTPLASAHPSARGAPFSVQARRVNRPGAGRPQTRSLE